MVETQGDMGIVGMRAVDCLLECNDLGVFMLMGDRGRCDGTLRM
jgi:hypothetical protein